MTHALTLAVARAADEQDELGGVAAWAVDLMERLGGPGAGLAIALENLFPPVPSEVILPLAGFTASQGSFGLAEAIIWTTLGSLVGAVVMYYLGAALGRRRMYAIWHRLPLVRTDDLERAEAWFGRHGTKAVFLGRMVPIFRSLISVPAGLERMSLPLFMLLTIAGSAIWNTVFVVAGYVLGEQWHRVEAYAGIVQSVVILTVVVAVCWWVVSRVRTLRAARGPRT
jgi:membrane protein DedA with SNARE-associated domain